MDNLQAVILAFIQGITEFLPISSSAHLILPKEVFGWPDQGLAFDVAVHVGTLSAVLIYFRKDVAQLFVGWFATLAQRQMNPHGHLAWMIIAATIPAGLAGLLFADFIEHHLRSMAVIAATTIGFGLLLGYADKRHRVNSELIRISLWMALFIGCAQALALIPGTSRSGITITAALLIGLSREHAARFSFLLSIPIIVLSGGHEGLKLLNDGGIDLLPLLIGVVVSAVSAYTCIYLFLGFINRIGMMPFVIYRLLLGGALIALMLI